MKFIGLVAVCYWPHYSDVGLSQQWYTIRPLASVVPPFFLIGPPALRRML